MSSAGSDTFQSAVAYINNLPASANVSASTQLQLYAAYKCVTAGISPTATRPSFFDMAGRAKWDSWNDLGKSLQDEVDPVQAAEERYIQQAHDLGWSESREKFASSSGSTTDGSKGGAKGGGGMGISVSVPAACEEIGTEHPVHGYAVKGDVEGLSALLNEQPELANLRDEFEYTPLHLAADRGHLEVVRLLLSKGADVKLKDQDGDTSLEIAEAAKREDIAQLLREHSDNSD